MSGFMGSQDLSNYATLTKLRESTVLNALTVNRVTLETEGYIEFRAAVTRDADASSRIILSNNIENIQTAPYFLCYVGTPNSSGLKFVDAGGTDSIETTTQLGNTTSKVRLSWISGTSAKYYIDDVLEATLTPTNTAMDFTAFTYFHINLASSYLNGQMFREPLSFAYSGITFNSW